MQDDNGTLFVVDDENSEEVRIVDQGNGVVSVQCQNQGDDRTDPRRFSGVTGIDVKMNGGDDTVEYSSVNDVNDALTRVSFPWVRATTKVLQCRRGRYTGT